MLWVVFSTFPSQGRGLPLPLSLPVDQHGGAGGGHPVSFLLLVDFLALLFFDLFCDPLVIPHLALLEPTCSVLVSNLAAKTNPKCMVLGFKSELMLQDSKLSKFVQLLSENLVFASPGPPKTSQNRQKTDLKSLLC